MKEFGFAIVGCGIIGKLQAEVIDEIDHAKLVAVCSATEKSARTLGEKYGCDWYTDYDEMLARKDVEVVTVCTPSSMHYTQTIAAAKAKKHVICEKPIDIEVEKAREMTRVCHENGVMFSVIFQRRFDDATYAVRRAIKDGLFGKLTWGASRSIIYRDTEYYSEPWRGTWATDGGGVLINQAIHQIDLFLSIFGPVKSVSGKCRRVLHHEIEAEDLGVASIEFTNGAIGTIEASTACYPGIYSEIAIFGEKGSVIIRNNHITYCAFQDGVPDYMQELLTDENSIPAPKGSSQKNDAHARQFKNIIKALLTGTQPEVSGESATNSLELIKAIYTSSAENREVYLQKH
ncbi:MAG: Gfo/Idh/MocA family oxidoreductase [Clostridia bacterium]